MRITSYDNASSSTRYERYRDCVSGRLYELSEWALDEEHDRANAIDTKCAAIFTSSSFLVAGMAALQVAIVNSSEEVSMDYSDGATHRPDRVPAFLRA